MKPLLLVLLLAFTAHAQTLTSDDWLFLGTVQNQYGDSQNQSGIAQAFIKPGSIQRNGDLIKVSFKVGFPVGSSWLTPFWKGPSLSSVVRGEGPLIFNCKKKQVESGEIAFYDRFDNTVGIYRSKEKLKEKPGSISWAAFEYLCERPQARPTQKPQLKP